MIRITSNLDFDLNVPYPSPRGMTPKFFTLPAAKGGKPGVVELDELDSITIQRLTWHYEWRPSDAANKSKAKHELKSDEIHNIGLLRIEILDGKPRKQVAA